MLENSNDLSKLKSAILELGGDKKIKEIPVDQILIPSPKSGLMAETQFKKLLDSVRNTTTPTAREKQVQEAAANYKFSCSQLEAIVKMLSHPAERIVIAQLMVER